MEQDLARDTKNHKKDFITLEDGSLSTLWYRLPL